MKAGSGMRLGRISEIKRVKETELCRLRND